MADPIDYDKMTPEELEAEFAKMSVDPQPTRETEPNDG